VIAKVTEYEFKSELEAKKPKNWIKTVSAYANGHGVSFLFGADDNGNVIGLKNVLKPLLESGQLRMTIPDSRNQKYVKVLENDRHEIR
jgi:ATP-dependent DNA helicase RecG